MQATTKNATDKRRRGLSNVIGSLLLIILTAVSALLLGHYAFTTMTAIEHNPSIIISDASAINPGDAFPSTPVYIQFTVTDNGNVPMTLGSISIAGININLNPTVLVEPGQTLSFNAVLTYNTSSKTYTLQVSALGYGYSATASSIVSSSGGLWVGSTIDIQVMGLVQGSQPPQWIYIQTPVVIQD